MPQLLGDGDTFADEFPDNGDYVVTLNGYVFDTGGRRLEIRGTYDLIAANVLDIETALLPTTPFEVGDHLPVAVTIMPGIPADVSYTITQVRANGDISSQTFTGRANENGWWDGDGAVWAFQRDGEYWVDVQACYAVPTWCLDYR